MMNNGDRHGQLWTEPELVLALYLYCQLPFRTTTAGNPFIRALASRLRRTPASVARKLGNFGSLDPVLASQGIVGLTHASKADRQTWDRYEGRWALLVDEVARIWPGADRQFPDQAVSIPALSPLSGPSEAERTVKVRRHQAFFRRTVTSSYEESCCMCGLEIPRLLVASHIVPWSVDENLRTDPTNGLCLCALHDRAFDVGLMCVGPQTRILVSQSVMAYRSEAVRQNLLVLAGKELRRPVRFAANPERLAWHRSNIFIP